MLNFIANSSPINLVIVGVFLLGAIFIIVKAIKELSIKIGNKELSFNSKKAQSKVIKVVTDYADFKYKIKEEQTEGIIDIHEQAKRTVAVQLNQYIKRITVDYIDVLSKDKTKDTNLIMNIFSLLMRILYNEIYKFCMDIYECNHLNDKTDTELKELTEVNYERLGDIFRSFMCMNWIDIMGKFEVLNEVCISERDFVKGLLLQMLVSFRRLSQQKYELINIINDIDCKVRNKVQELGTLPNNAISILSDLYIPGTGLNRISVEKWLVHECDINKNQGGR